MLPLSHHAEGTRLAIRLTPRGGRNAIDRIALDASGRPELRVRIAAAPVDGAANAALIAWLADMFALRKADITLLSGASSRSKTILVKAAPEEVEAKLLQLLA